MNAIAQDQNQDLAFSIEIKGQKPGSLLVTDFNLTESLSECYYGTATSCESRPLVVKIQCVALATEIRK